VSVIPFSFIQHFLRASAFSRDVKAPIAVGVSFLSLFVGIALGVAGFSMFLRRRSRSFVKLQDSTSLESQINPFQTYEEGSSSGQTQVYVVHHDDRGVPPVTILHNEQTEIVELPPSYPEYSRAQSKALALSSLRDIGRSRSLSAASSTSPIVSPSNDSDAAPDHMELHYGAHRPRGPLGLHQTRQTGSLPRKSSLTPESS
jgi:hypothetical protein